MFDCTFCHSYESPIPINIDNSVFPTAVSILAPQSNNVELYSIFKEIIS